VFYQQWQKSTRLSLNEYSAPDPVKLVLEQHPIIFSQSIYFTNQQAIISKPIGTLLEYVLIPSLLATAVSSSSLLIGRL
jgi:hypothetical protein